MFRKILTSAVLAIGLAVPVLAQKFPRDGRLYLGNDSTHYFKFTLNNQLWLRSTHANPGSTTNGSALHAYAAFTNVDFGPNYVRDNGPMNPANGNRISTVLNAAGNAFPLVGIGNVFYAQVGYKFQNGLLGTYGTLMPYASAQHARFELLNDPGTYYDAGVNWLLAGHNSRLTLAYPSRPVFVSNALTPTDSRLTEHRGSVVLQYQAYFN